MVEGNGKKGLMYRCLHRFLNTFLFCFCFFFFFNFKLIKYKNFIVRFVPRKQLKYDIVLNKTEINEKYNLTIKIEKEKWLLLIGIFNHKLCQRLPNFILCLRVLKPI